ncbi:MAG TPA: hypothetical protein EYG70_03575 [Sulfurimonas sp.]|nr:hypothetical protein [Sulfurimonas sp.]
MKIILTILLTLFLSTALFAVDKNNKDDVDYVVLATLLMKDGYYNRANQALKNVDITQEDLDKAQFFTLKGLIQLKLHEYQASNTSFLLAIKNGQKEKSVYLYIAQNYFKLKLYARAIEALENANELVNEKPKLMALKAECFYRLHDYNNALITLKEVNLLHPEYYDAYKQRFAYYISLELYQSALDDANIYLENADTNEKVTISFISALRKAKETHKATVLAEEAHLKYDKNVIITILLANLYIDINMIESAATLFDEASLQDNKYIKDSSEMFRRAKDFVQAIYKNSQILDTKEKYKQKVAIYLEFSQYERVIATESALIRNDLLKDENLVYALAFSYYKVGEFDQSEKYLKKITQNNLFTKSIELRKNMDKCKNNHWECSL